MKRLLVLVLAGTFLFALVSFTFASESEVLPQGVWRVRIPFNYFWGNKKFDADGNKVTLVPDTDYQNPAYSAGVGLPADHVYGTITGDGKMSIYASGFVLEYGFTDKLGGRILIPCFLKERFKYGWGWRDNDDDDAYLIGIGQPADPLGTTVLDNTKQGFPDLKGSGIGDIITGVQYRYLGTDRDPEGTFPQYEAAAAFGARWPTGKKDDPDDPDDFATGDGQTDIGLWLLGDCHILRQLSVGASIKYENQLKKDNLNLGDKLLIRTVASTYLKDVELVGYSIPLLQMSLVFNANFEGSDKQNGTKIQNSNTTFYSIGPEITYCFFEVGIPCKIQAYYLCPLGGKNTYALQELYVEAQIFMKF